MSTKRMDGKLLRWNKKGDMVLKNKVKDAILRENTYEERSLHTTLDYLDRHKTQEEKHLVNKQLQFAATKHRALHEKNPRVRFLSRGRSWSDGVLAEHHSRIECDHENSIGKPAFNPKLKWKKAISVVRFAVQDTKKINSRSKQTMQRPASFLPPLPISRRERTDSKGMRTSKHHPVAGDLVLPVISKDGHKETRNCLEDPRFLKLKQILSYEVEEIAAEIEKRGLYGYNT